ncbi:MAG TPA: hypothetical protein DCE43_16980 [Planctomycetaceae bacterium]|nr:hypothetical protein [Planctomycetaceae bacterium]
MTTQHSSPTPGTSVPDALQSMAQSLAAPFRKDAAEEFFLDDLNQRLAAAHDQELVARPELFPTLHVVGPPRSGTTLLMQLLTAHLEVGYINNLIAAFWRAPLYGIRLSRKLCPQPADTRFVSRYGRTDAITEPHEFGYFWKELLGYSDLAEPMAGHEETIDWERVRVLLTAMTHEFRGPVVFKSFLVGWHARRLCQELSRTCVVQIRRDPTDTARSLYGMRKNYGGSIDTWTSLKPKEYEWLKDEPVWDQLVGQVHFLEKRFDEQVADVDPARVLRVEYSRLCADPRGVLEEIRQLLSRQMADDRDITPRGTPPREFRLSHGGGVTDEQARQLAAAVSRFFPGRDAGGREAA